MKPVILSMLFMVGCSRNIDVKVNIQVVDTGGSSTSSSQPESEPSSAQPSNEPSAQPSNEPSAQPSNEPSAQPSNEPSAQPGNEPSSQPGNEPSNQPSNQPTNEPSTDTGNPGDPGQQQGGVDFCSLTQTYIDCGNADGNPGLSYCDDPESAGNWLGFFDCLVEANSTDCAALNDCASMVP